MSIETKPMRVDAHQHFWQYTREEFGWINDSMAAIRRDFLPADLLPLLDEAGIDATVAVQACQSLAETEWLLELADKEPRIAGVVGWVPLIDPNVERTLDTLSANPKLKGVRHVLQGEPDEYMARDDFNSGIALLQRYSLTYDVLIFERQLPAAIRFVDKHPEQPMVLDHIAKPLIAVRELEPWRTHIRELARRPHVSCKLSGMVTEADFDEWTVDDLRPYVETALEAFGPERLLFGSDWPVCAAACGYVRWANVVKDFVSELSRNEQEMIFGRNAVRFYRLDESSY
ncbi:amidohydrolase family protein [Acidicapsa acidisoli]|uniref:amidohydrolase family protein n=1 Tax=Acidicapsa acidisoli TaxID=1615681 RepID=UPI0021E0F864|nr:amidohydrolase family protein [Acidicapsa acidisoli]